MQVLKISNLVSFCLSVGLTLLGVAFCFIRLQKDPLNKRWSMYLLVCIGALLSGTVNSEIVFGLLMKLKLDRLDMYAFMFDKMLGEPSFVVGRLMLEFQWLDVSARVAYMYIYPTMIVTLSWYFLTQSYEDAIAVAKSIFLSQLVVLVYIVLPVSGPRYAFPNFPASFDAITAHAVSLDAVPNGVPSGHLTIAMLVAYFGRRWWAGKVLGALNLLLTTVATLGMGEHYAFDLFAAVPFTMFLLYVSDDAFTIKCNALLIADRYVPRLNSIERIAQFRNELRS